MSSSKKARAKVENSAHSHYNKKHGNPKDSTLGVTYSNYLWGALILILSVAIYWKPHFVFNVLNDWIGFSEHWDSAPAVNSPVVESLQADVSRREAIVQAFKHAWSSYEQHAMGADEYHPISHEGTNLEESGGIGYTIVDCLDTMILMGLNEEYERAKQWVDSELSFERDGHYSTFEVTIRVLGGLLSAYHLSGGDPIFSSKSIDLAERLLPAFETTSGLPLPLINLAKREAGHTADFPGLVSIAEVGTLQLEFRYLSSISNNPVYWKKVGQIMNVVKKARLPHGMASIFMSVDDGQYVTSAVRLGSRADSFYEYLLKQYIQSNHTEEMYKEMYTDSMDSIHSHLIQKTRAGGYTYTSELQPEKDANGEISWRRVPKQDHLVCFLAGSLILGAVTVHSTVPLSQISRPPRPDELTKTGLRDWQTGFELLRTCLHTHDTATGLSPEMVHFRIASDGMDNIPDAPPDWYIKGAQRGEPAPYSARYMLRPETVESLFIAYRLTGDERYREHGWRIFSAIEKHCRIPTGGYATVINVDEAPAQHEDKMETFFLSETLKYLYLLFSDDSVLPLDRYVFNTEAHPLPIFTTST